MSRHDRAAPKGSLWAVLEAIGAIYTWIDAEGHCQHPCCPQPCEDPAHVQGEIAWPPVEDQIARAAAELTAHRGPSDSEHRANCLTCFVLEGLLHDAKLTARLAGCGEVGAA